MAAKLRLVQFEAGDSTRVGVELADGGSVVDITAIDPAIPRDMKTFLEGGEDNLAAAHRAVEQAKSLGQSIFSVGNFKLKAPISNPEKVICIGMNYKDHCQEQNLPIPEEPVVFSKFSSAIVGPTADIVLPGNSDEVDYEVEMAFIIGKTGRNISEAEGMSYIVGFTVADDVSARDWQLRRNGKQFLLGKTYDTFCPLGPAIVTTPSLSNPHNLGIRCYLNGERMQSSNTDQLVFNCGFLVSHLSQFFTLKPGDIVLTGTPGGVGCFRNPPIWLKKGDVVTCEIDEIGKITNRVV